MKLLEDTASVSYQIQAYKPGCVTISGQDYHQSLIVLPETLITTWPVAKIQDLSLASIAMLADLRPELILLGTGNGSIFIEPYLLQPIIKLKIGMDVMSTAAACRTYAILAAEGRRVAAALII